MAEGSKKLAFASGALLGLTGVIAGAMGAHALEKVLTPDQLGSFETAVRFQMYHALVLLITGMLIHFFNHRLLQYAAWLFLVGTLLFSGSIYLLVLGQWPVGLVTPTGGSLLIIGWALLVVWAFSGFPEKK